MEREMLSLEDIENFFDWFGEKCIKEGRQYDNSSIKNIDSVLDEPFDEEASDLESSDKEVNYFNY